MITKLEINALNLLTYNPSVCEIETHTDPKHRKEGMMIVHFEGTINSDYIHNRIILLDAVISEHSDLYIRTDKMREDAVAAVEPSQQTIPLHKPSSEFILVWTSNTPYFTGVNTGEKYAY